MNDLLRTIAIGLLLFVLIVAGTFGFLAWRQGPPPAPAGEPSPVPSAPSPSARTAQTGEPARRGSTAEARLAWNEPAGLGRMALKRGDFEVAEKQFDLAEAAMTGDTSVTEQERELLAYWRRELAAERHCAGLAQRLRGLPAKGRVAAVKQALREVHGREIPCTFEVEGEAVVAAVCHGQIEFVQPFRGLALRRLELVGDPKPVRDLTPLVGMPLEVLRVHHARLERLDFVGGLRLRVLDVRHCPVKGIKALRGKSFDELQLVWLEVDDFAPLATVETPLLNLAGNRHLKELGVLAELPLRSLDIRRVSVRDPAPLAELPLEHLACTIRSPSRWQAVLLTLTGLQSLELDFQGDVGELAFLAKLPNLTTIDGQPARMYLNSANSN